MADRHAALEVIDHLAVPRRGVEVIRALVEGREHGDTVEEPVDGPPLPANDVVDGQPVHGRGLRHVRRRWITRNVRLECPVAGLVDIGHQSVGAAVHAVADDHIRRVSAGIGGVDRKALGRVVHQRLTEPIVLDAAHEGVLVRTREHRSGDRIVGHSQGRRLGQALALTVLFDNHQYCRQGPARR